MSNPDIIIYTDGACSGNPGPGGWGALLVQNGAEQEISGGEPDTTNNRMELRAIIEALMSLEQSQVVTVVTDSKYAMQGMTEWIDNWKRRGWKTANKKPVKNKDLWLQLDEQVARHDVTWQWVKGHDGHEGNERADALATNAIDY